MLILRRFLILVTALMHLGSERCVSVCADKSFPVEDARKSWAHCPDGWRALRRAGGGRVRAQRS